MRKMVLILLLSIYSMAAFGQTADTLLYSGLKLNCSIKFDKRPEPTADLDKFIWKNIMYPDEAREGSIQGKVYIQFTIDETGNVTKPVIVSSPHKSLSEEAIRLVGLMPAWSPAILNGTPIPVSLTMPLVFRLE